MVRHIILPKPQPGVKTVPQKGVAGLRQCSDSNQAKGVRSSTLGRAAVLPACRPGSGVVCPPGTSPVIQGIQSRPPLCLRSSSEARCWCLC